MLFCFLFFHNLSSSLYIFFFFFYIGTTEALDDTLTSTAANKNPGVKLSPNIPNISKTSSSKLKRKCFEKNNENKNIIERRDENVIVSSTTSSETAVIEVLKTKPKESSSSHIIQNDHKKLTISTRQKQNKTTLQTSHDTKIQRFAAITRNTTKKELMSKMIITRNRRSQENIAIQTIYSKNVAKANVGKSRIPIRKRKTVISTESVKK